MHIKVEFDFGQRQCIYDAELVKFFERGVAFDDFIWLSEQLEDLVKVFFSASCDVLNSAEETIREVNDDL